MGFVETMGQILVVKNPSAVGQWRCVDGMHRVTALQNLVQTGMNDKFQRVPMTILHPDITQEDEIFIATSQNVSTTTTLNTTFYNDVQQVKRVMETVLMGRDPNRWTSPRS